MLAEILMLRLEATVRASEIDHPEHVSIRPHHLAGGAFDADIRSKYSRGLNGNESRQKRPTLLHSRETRPRLLATTSLTLKSLP